MEKEVEKEEEKTDDEDGNATINVDDVATSETGGSQDQEARSKYHTHIKEWSFRRFEINIVTYHPTLRKVLSVARDVSNGYRGYFALATFLLLFLRYQLGIPIHPYVVWPVSAILLITASMKLSVKIQPPVAYRD